MILKKQFLKPTKELNPDLEVTGLNYSNNYRDESPMVSNYIMPSINLVNKDQDIPLDIHVKGLTSPSVSPHKAYKKKRKTKKNSNSLDEQSIMFLDTSYLFNIDTTFRNKDRVKLPSITPNIQKPKNSLYRKRKSIYEPKPSKKQTPVDFKQKLKSNTPFPLKNFDIEPYKQFGYNVGVTKGTQCEEESDSEKFIEEYWRKLKEIEPKTPYFKPTLM